MVDATRAHCEVAADNLLPADLDEKICKQDSETDRDQKVEGTPLPYSPGNEGNDPDPQQAKEQPEVAHRVRDDDSGFTGLWNGPTTRKISRSPTSDRPRQRLRRCDD